MEKIVEGTADSWSWQVWDGGDCRAGCAIALLDRLKRQGYAQSRPGEMEVKGEVMGDKAVTGTGRLELG